MKPLKITIVVIGLMMTSLLTACAVPDHEQDIISHSVCDSGEVIECEEQPVETDKYVVENVKKSKKEHEHGKIFAFGSENSTAWDYVKPWCKSGKCCYLGYSLFRGTPSDTSYLDVIREHIDSEKIVGGEYYTVTARITLADYDFTRTSLGCRLQNDDIIVDFSVEFREEFEEAVGLLDEGDEVTFRGRFYDEGCGFTDCELIPE